MMIDATGKLILIKLKKELQTQPNYPRFGYLRIDHNALLHSAMNYVYINTWLKFILPSQEGDHFI